ncbi:MAG TPA: glycosyltransferase family 2 protein [Anaerolineae bacterium]|nr:glycosyltransferase family 2 protein [Anaerolineae bacterium]
MTNETTASAEPMISLIVPTRNEAGNVRLLLERVGATAKEAGLSIEVLFVDDSTDDTPDVIKAIAPEFDFDVRVLHRPVAERNGLSGAVVAGFKGVRGTWMLVMDADLQHPPELIPQLYERARMTNADVVVGSRLAAEQGPIGLSRIRSLGSRSLTILARALFPQALKYASDPLTGLFLVRRAVVDPDQLYPEGFKILLEVLVRCGDIHVSEVHFEFGERHAGESKAGLNEIVRFLRHILRLRLTANKRFQRFILAGTVGIVLNSLVLLAVVARGGWHYVLGVVAAWQVSTLWNFALTELWVFSDRRSEGKLSWLRVLRYLLMNLILMVVWHLPILIGLVGLVGIHYLLANLVGVMSSAFIRYVLSDQWIWTKRSIALRPTFYRYDIHGILGVESTVALPELAYFEQEEPLEQVDIQVTVDRYGTPRCAPGFVCFNDRLGRLGFGVSINLRPYTEVVVAPLLSRTPHVLYTNVVEPLIRWALVRKGYALVQGTCVAYGERAVLVLTEAAKTPPQVRTLVQAPLADGQKRAFMGDEMVILGADGRVLAYPKPLLINPKLLAGVLGINLRIGERILLTVQGRLYSWFSRRIGMWMQRWRLPAATLNAYMQLLFPPPKYLWHNLVPLVPYQAAAQLAAVVLVQRGRGEREAASAADAFRWLTANAADAYGFPPYPTLAPQLSQWEGKPLAPQEQTVMATAMDHCQQAIWGVQGSAWWGELIQFVADEPGDEMKEEDYG